jgi:hypothetical protein
MENYQYGLIALVIILIAMSIILIGRRDKGKKS